MAYNLLCDCLDVL